MHQAAYLLAGLTLVSQILALLRDRLFAHSFGASTTLDLYYASFKIPDLVFALVASLVSAYVLIPRITGAPKESTRRLLSHAASFLFIAGGIVSLGAAVWMPQLLAGLFPELAHAEGAHEFVFLARLLLVQPLLLGLSGVLTSVTQVERRFFLFALSPVLYNLGIIAGAWFLYPLYGIAGIGYGVLAGAFMHLAIHFPVVARAGVFPRFVLPDSKLMWSVVRDSVPRSLALSFGAVTTLVLTMLASRAGEGSVALFSIAGNLEAVPLALIGASYATAAFPVLSEEAKKEQGGAFRETLRAAGSHIIFWSSVVAILSIVLRAHLVRVLYGTGAFDWDATRLTAALLAVLILGLAAQGIVLIAARAFYAMRRSFTPLIIQVLGLAVSAVFAVACMTLADASPGFRYFIESLLRIEGITNTTVVFVALGATLGQIAMGILALLSLSGIAPGIVRDLVRPLFEGLAAGILGGAAGYEVLAAFGNIAPLSTFGAVFTQGLLAGMVGLAVAGGVLAMLENREFRAVYEALRKLSGKALSPSGPVLTDRSHL